MRSSVTVAFTPRVLESLACVNTFTSVLGLLSHTARSICETAGVLTPRVLSKGPQLWGVFCRWQCLPLPPHSWHFYSPLAWKRWFHSDWWRWNRWSEPWSQGAAAATGGRTSAASGPCGMEKGDPSCSGWTSPCLPLLSQGLHCLQQTCSCQEAVLRYVTSFSLRVYSDVAKAPNKLFLENRECFSGNWSVINQGQRHLLVHAFKYSPLWLIFSLLANNQFLASERAAFYHISLRCGSEPNFLSLLQLGVIVVWLFICFLPEFPVEEEEGVAAEEGNSRNVLFQTGLGDPRSAEFLSISCVTPAPPNKHLPAWVVAELSGLTEAKRIQEQS